MNSKYVVIIFILFSLISPNLFSVTKDLKPNCTTSQCHNNIDQFQYLHRPMKTKKCSVCHETDTSTFLKNGPKHPKLKPINENEINTICYMCHKNDLTERFGHNHFKLHSAIEQKSCVSCHNPHGSNHPKFLKENAAPELCFQCHDEIKKTLNNSTVLHSPTTSEDSCLNCHEAHAAFDKNLLKKPVLELCLDCHNKVQKTKTGQKIQAIGFELSHYKFLHTPAKDKCQSCHKVHGSNNEHLLNFKIQKNFYSQFNESDYSLCFDCHKPTLVQNEITNSATGFRNNTKNLHYLHTIARGKKGINCFVCHNAHGSNQDKGINEFTEFLGKKISIQFTQSKDGGTCATACHHSKTYNRTKEFINSPGR